MSTTATAPASENAWAGQGAVLLDIGGEVGALVVTMPASMVGAEVEIRPLRGTVGSVAHHSHQHGRQQGQQQGDHEGHHHHGDHEHLAHVAVVARPVAGGEVPSLVFPELPDGGYELFGKGQPAAVSLRVDVVGGEVTVTDWPR